MPRPSGLPRGDVVDRGVLGELGLALLLQRDPLASGPQVGWGGDRFVTLELADGSGTCTWVDVVMDTAAARDEPLEAPRRQDHAPVGRRVSRASRRR